MATKSQIVVAMRRELPVRWSKLLNSRTIEQMATELGYVQHGIVTVKGVEFFHDQVEADALYSGDTRRYELAEENDPASLNNS